MDQKEIRRYAERYVAEQPTNRIQAELALAPQMVGLAMFEAPLVGYAAADDPYFARCKDEDVVGPHHLAPREWLPAAQTVVSFFFPFTERVRRANALDMTWPAPEWLHARIEGQQFLTCFIKDICDELSRSGYQTIVPMLDPRFAQPTQFTSNWSERHVAHACGLGTFGLSKGLITARGVAGRYCSLITERQLEPSAKPYTRYDEYCNRCGKCVPNCPGDAIDLKRGKDHLLCDSFIAQTRIREKPRYGCGKCQVAVPRETGIPGCKGA